MDDNTLKSPCADGYTNPVQLEHPVMHVHDGHAYALPQPLQDSGVKFDFLDLTFRAGEEDTRCVMIRTEGEDREFAALTEHADYELTVNLWGVNITDEHAQDVPVAAYVYRKQCREPLYRLDLVRMEHDYNQSLQGIKLPPGDYFILIHGMCANYTCRFDMEEMAGMDTFHFSIMEHGSRLEHPTLVCRQIEEMPLLQLKAKKGKLKECDFYHLNCYNNTYRKVYTRKCIVSENTMTIALMDPAWPVDDHYTLVLYHNNEPFMAYTYTLLDKRVCHLRENRLQPFGPVYTLAAALENQTGVQRFMNEPGFKTFKEYVLDVQCHDIEPGNTMVACEVQPTDDFIRCSLELLHYTPDVGIVDATELIKAWEKRGTDCMSNLTEFAVVCIRHAELLLKPRYQPLLEALDEHIYRELQPMYFFESTQTVEALLRRLTAAGSLFAHKRRLLEAAYEPSDVVYIVNRHLTSAAGCRLAPAARKELFKLVMENEDAFAPMSIEELERWVDTVLIPAVNRKYAEELDEDLCEVLEVAVSFDKLALPDHPHDEMEVCLSELDSLVGLETLKTRLKSLFNRVKIEHMRQEHGLPALEENRHHMLFTGNPGTGKTTVARIMGKIFKQLGVLSNGEVITAERADMVGKYIGHTEDQMKELLEKAKGNVLFIDEAYSLCDNTGPDRSDYGHRAIECLLGVLAEPNPDLIVIMAGYGKQMNQLLEMNPGLKGRFVHTFNFEDYDASQLLEISVNKLYGKQFSLDDNIKRAMMDCIRRTLAGKDELFHNARWAEQFVMQGILTAMADRLCALDRPLTYEELRTVTLDDVYEGYALTAPVSKPKRNQVGFH